MLVQLYEKDRLEFEKLMDLYKFDRHLFYTTLPPEVNIDEFNVALANTVINTNATYYRSALGILLNMYLGKLNFIYLLNNACDLELRLYLDVEFSVEDIEIVIDLLGKKIPTTHRTLVLKARESIFYLTNSSFSLLLSGPGLLQSKALPLVTHGQHQYGYINNWKLEALFDHLPVGNYGTFNLSKYKYATVGTVFSNLIKDSSIPKTTEVKQLCKELSGNRMSYL